MLKAILFDLDGTLTHTDPLHFEVWQTVLAPYGLEFDQAFYNVHFSGRLNLGIVQELLPSLSLSAAQSLSEYKEACFRVAAAQKLQPLPGLIPLLDWCQQQGLKTAVVTNAPRPNAYFMLEAIGLADHFDPVIISDDLPRGKPDPLPYQEALRRLAIAPDNALVFEDSPTGIKAAVAAQIATIGLTTSQSSDTLYPLGIKLAIADFTDPRLSHFGLMT